MGKVVKVYQANCLDEKTQTYELVDVTSKFDEEIDLVSGRYVVDAKSIMGIFGLDLLNPVTILIHTEDTDIANNLFMKLEKVGIK